MKNNIRRYIFSTILLMFIVNIASAVTVEINPQYQTIIKNQSFDFNIYIDAQKTPIAGVQTDILYNKSIIKINRISEGNLFNQYGDDTFFNSGIINNTIGKSYNIFDVIIGPKNISSSGIFIIVNVTAINTGNSYIELSNTKISSPDAVLVPFNITNGYIKVEYPRYDVDQNGIVDIRDIIIVSNHFGDVTFSPHPSYDINMNNIIDIFDVVIVSNKFGYSF